VPFQPSTVDSALAAAIRRSREEQGVTQEDLAYRANLTTSAYARIELGRANPAWSTVRRIAAALELTLEDLGRLVEHHEP
jgi:transcriptional regulator with XRE-family HTH domain